MNPWDFVRREIDGAIRSFRYDLANRRARRLMTEDTTELPVITPGDARKKKRVIVATSVALVAAGTVSGYYALSSGLDALIADGGSPTSLPQTGPRKTSPSPTPAKVVPTSETVVQVPVAHTSGLPPKPGQTNPAPPAVSPPVPTPAPTCNCPTPTPTPTPSPTVSPTPPAPIPSPSSTQPTATPTSTATP